MENSNYYLGVEFTSRAIKCLAGFCLNNQIYVLDKVEADCHGLKNGMIIDEPLVLKTFQSVVKEIEDHLKIHFTDVTVALPSINMLCKVDTGTTITVDGNNVIQHVDTMNILTAMKKSNASLYKDLTIIDIVPDTYIINETERYDEEPLGKISQSLSLHGAIYALDTPLVNAVKHLISQSCLTLKHLVPSSHAAALYLSTKAKMPESYILLDIGYQLTTVSFVHNKTQVIDSKTILFGGDDITNEIGRRFNLSYNEAELLKCRYGMEKSPAFPLYIEGKITFDDLSQAIKDVLKRNLEKVRDLLESDFEGSENLPLIVIGGTSNLNNFYMLLANALNRTVLNFDMENIGARNKNMISVLGIIKYESKRTPVVEEETITSSITRVDNKKVSKKQNYKFDEEL